MGGQSGVGGRWSRLALIFLVPPLMAVTLSSSFYPCEQSPPTTYLNFGVPANLHVGSPGLPPIAVASPPRAEVLVGERLVLSGEDSYDSDGEIVSYLWSFGESGGVEFPRITVQFTATGVKNVSLTVTDDRGMTATAWSVILVTEPAPRPILLLTAGAVNVFEIAPGSDMVVELRVAVIGQRATGLRLTVVDDGGLEVESAKMPWSLDPSEELTVRLKVHAPAELVAPVGATVQIVVQSDQGVSNVERLEFTLPAEPPASGIPWGLVETAALLTFAALLCVSVERRRRR